MSKYFDILYSIKIYFKTSFAFSWISLNNDLYLKIPFGFRAQTTYLVTKFLGECPFSVSGRGYWFLGCVHFLKIHQYNALMIHAHFCWS